MASVFAVWPVDLSSTIKVNRGARMGLRRTAALASSFRPVVCENAFTMKTSHLDGTEDIQKSWKEKIASNRRPLRSICLGRTAPINLVWSLSMLKFMRPNCFYPNPSLTKHRLSIPPPNTQIYFLQTYFLALWAHQRSL